MNKYLATDLDGTLLYPKLKYTYVSSENIKSLKIFDGNVIIVSGRNQLFVKKICKQLGIEETYVSCNGAVVSYKGKEIFLKYIDTNILNKIINHVKNTYKQYKIILFDNKGNLYSICDDYNRSTKMEQDYLKKHPKIGYKTNKNMNKIQKLIEQKDSITKINVVLAEEQKLELYNYLKDNNYNISYVICKGSLEITAPNISKGQSLKFLTDYMQLNPNDVYVAGDDKNDISMFETYKHSFLINHQDNLYLTDKVMFVVDKFKDIAKHIKEE